MKSRPEEIHLSDLTEHQKQDNSQLGQTETEADVLVGHCTNTRAAKLHSKAARWFQDVRLLLLV